MTEIATLHHTGLDNLDISGDFLTALSASPHSFLQPSSSLHISAISAAKRLLDPLASDVNQTQEQRRQENRKKRKRSEVESEASKQVLQLREVYTEGFGIGQIWEQARRVLDAAANELERDITDVVQEPKGSSQSEDGNVPGDDVRMVQFDEDGFEVDSDEASDVQVDESETDNVEGDTEELDEDNNQELDAEEYEDIEEDELDQSSADEKPAEIFVPDPNGLNDGFFSIDDFNRRSQFMEQQDAQGDDDNPSDEDEVDWDADPLTMGFSQPKSNTNIGELDDIDDDDEEKGPRFGDADLTAPFSDDDNEGIDNDVDLADGMGGGLDNTNDIQYADFFEPPAKKPSKTKRMRALPKTQPPPKPVTDGDQDVENDIQRAISDVRRDLLDSEDEDDEPSLVSDADSNDDTDAQRPSKKSKNDTNLSTHERQKATIAAEIRRLEAANVSKRDWTLSGEARAADRPMNSLIEEDLEFERVGKPVPVITAEVSEAIEVLIKRRILAKEFDEVVRRRPETVRAVADAKRGRAAIELDDAKPQQGLAEVYEQEHLKRTDPGYVDKRSAGLKKQHEEISRLWKEVSGQLDILSNLHFRPKRPDVEVKVVGDKPTISMEDARPGAGGLGGESMLAPQEIYRPGEEGKKNPGEVMGKSGVSVAREEMTREEKLRRRRRDKERGKKSNGNVVAQQQQLDRRAGKKGGKADKGQEKRDILSELKRGGVQVIGKQGKLEDLGKKTNKVNGRALESASALKL